MFLWILQWRALVLLGTAALCSAAVNPGQCEDNACIMANTLLQSKAHHQHTYAGLHDNETSMEDASSSLVAMRQNMNSSVGDGVHLMQGVLSRDDGHNKTPDIPSVGLVLGAITCLSILCLPPCVFRLRKTDDAPMASAISRQWPTLADESSFAEAREYVRAQGVSNLFYELLELGAIDGESGNLEAGARKNVFVEYASGIKTLPPHIAAEQEALGGFQRKYIVCALPPELQDNWETTDASLLPHVAMAARHRILIPRSLQWQSFNPIVLGLHGHAGEVLVELESVYLAAVCYTRHIGGWSSNIGMFTRAYGHHDQNSFALHIVDMDCLGPGFKWNEYRNLPLDVVAGVVRKEISGFEESLVLREQLHLTLQESIGIGARSDHMAFTG